MRLSDRVWTLKPVEHVVLLGMGMSLMDWNKICYKGEQPAGAKVWGIKSASIPYKTDLCIWMHDLKAASREKDRARVKRIDCPIVTVRATEQENTFEYPLSELISTYKINYLRNTTVYAIALAALSGAKTIDLYGCDFNYINMHGAYEEGRANLEFWIGFLSARGITVNVAEHSTLCDTLQRSGKVKDKETGRTVDAYYGYDLQQPILSDDGYVSSFEAGEDEFEAVEKVLGFLNTHELAVKQNRVVTPEKQG